MIGYANAFTWCDVLPPNLVKSRSCEIGCYNDRIALKLDRHLGGITAEVPVKCQSDWRNLHPNIAASILNEILGVSHPSAK